MWVLTSANNIEVKLDILLSRAVPGHHNNIKDDIDNKAVYPETGIQSTIIRLYLVFCLQFEMD